MVWNLTRVNRARPAAERAAKLDEQTGLGAVGGSVAGAEDSVPAVVEAPRRKGACFFLAEQVSGLMLPGRGAPELRTGGSLEEVSLLRPLIRAREPQTVCAQVLWGTVARPLSCGLLRMGDSNRAGLRLFRGMGALGYPGPQPGPV